MDQNRQNHDPIESLLVELQQAERAGVFRPTPVDATELLRPSRPVATRSLRGLAVAGLALAACVAFFAFSPLLTQVSRWSGSRTFVTGVPNAASRPAFSAAQFSTCVVGPHSGPSSLDCAPVDYDGDGDVDLADFGVAQVAGANSL